MATWIERPVNACSADANAMAVATDHIGKVNAVIAPPTPSASRPYRSPIRPEMVTTIRSRKGTTSSPAMSRTCTDSATPYQIADTPVW